MTIIKNNEQLQLVIDFLKSKNFKVYGIKEALTQERNWIKYVHDNRMIGAVEIDSRRGLISLSSVHKPCKQCGGGFQTYESIKTDDLKAYMLTAYMTAPGWASDADIAAIKKYKDWEDYAKNSYLDFIEL